MKVLINDKFPGASKGMTKDLDAVTAKELIANKWATEVKEKAKTAAEIKAEKEAQNAADLKVQQDAEADGLAKANEEADARKTKENKDAQNLDTK